MHDDLDGYESIPDRPVDTKRSWEDEVFFGVDRLWGGNYLGYLLKWGAIKELDKVRRFDDLVTAAGDKKLGGITDIDIDVLLHKHDDGDEASCKQAFESMKPHLVTLAERGYVCFLTNSSELSRFRDEPMNIKPEIAVPCNGELLEELARRASKLTQVIAAIKNAGSNEELNRIIPSVIDGIDREEFTFKDFAAALSKALGRDHIAFGRWIFVMSKMGVSAKDSEAGIERNGERLFMSVKQGKRSDKLDELILKNTRFTWKEGEEEIEALTLYNPAEKALKIFPTRKTLLADPELKKLDTQADDAYVPDRGLFGVIRIQELVAGDEPALWIDEVQPSIGFRQIKPSEKREKYRNWNRAAIEHIVSLAREAGFNIFYASTSQEIRERYKNEKKLNQGNLKENYHRPFRDDWQKTDIVVGRRQTKLWHRTESERVRSEAEPPRRGRTTNDGSIDILDTFAITKEDLVKNSERLREAPDFILRLDLARDNEYFSVDLSDVSNKIDPLIYFASGKISGNRDQLAREVLTEFSRNFREHVWEKDKTHDFSIELQIVQRRSDSRKGLRMIFLSEGSKMDIPDIIRGEKARFEPTNLIKGAGAARGIFLIMLSRIAKKFKDIFFTVESQGDGMRFSRQNEEMFISDVKDNRFTVTIFEDGGEAQGAMPKAQEEPLVPEQQLTPAERVDAFLKEQAEMAGRTHYDHWTFREKRELYEHLGLAMDSEEKTNSMQFFINHFFDRLAGDLLTAHAPKTTKNGHEYVHLAFMMRAASGRGLEFSEYFYVDKQYIGHGITTIESGKNAELRMGLDDASYKGKGHMQVFFDMRQGLFGAIFQPATFTVPTPQVSSWDAFFFYIRKGYLPSNPEAQKIVTERFLVPWLEDRNFRIDDPGKVFGEDFLESCGNHFVLFLKEPTSPAAAREENIRQAKIREVSGYIAARFSVRDEKARQSITDGVSAIIQGVNVTLSDEVFRKFIDTFTDEAPAVTIEDLMKAMAAFFEPDNGFGSDLRAAAKSVSYRTIVEILGRYLPKNENAQRVFAHFYHRFSFSATSWTHPGRLEENIGGHTFVFERGAGYSPLLGADSLIIHTAPSSPQRIRRAVKEFKKGEALERLRGMGYRKIYSPIHTLKSERLVKLLGGREADEGLYLDAGILKSLLESRTAYEQMTAAFPDVYQGDMLPASKFYCIDIDEALENAPTGHGAIKASKAWKRLAGIGGMFPSYIKVAQDESGAFLNRERHVLRGLETALAYSGSTERKMDPEKIRVIAYAHELGRLPFVHYVEKRLAAYFHEYKDMITAMTIGSEVKERYNQALAQDMLYEENGIRLDARTREDINSILLKRPDDIVTDEAKLFFIADTILGYVEDFVLTYKLSYNGRRIVEDFPDRARFLEFVFGTSDLSELDRLSLESFDGFAVRAALRLMEKVVDKGALTFKKDAMEELRRRRDNFETELFPSVDTLVRLDETMRPIFAEAKNRLMARQPAGLSEKEKERNVFRELLRMDETDLVNLSGFRQEGFPPVFSWEKKDAAIKVPSGRGYDILRDMIAGKKTSLKRPVVVGIDGDSGSGKTIFTDSFASENAGKYAVIRLDEYMTRSDEEGVIDWEGIGSAIKAFSGNTDLAGILVEGYGLLNGENEGYFTCDIRVNIFADPRTRWENIEKRNPQFSHEAIMQLVALKQIYGFDVDYDLKLDNSAAAREEVIQDAAGTEQVTINEDPGTGDTVEVPPSGIKKIIISEVGENRKSSEPREIPAKEMKSKIAELNRGGFLFSAEIKGDALTIGIAHPGAGHADIKDPVPSIHMLRGRTDPETGEISLVLSDPKVIMDLFEANATDPGEKIVEKISDTYIRLARALIELGFSGTFTFSSGTRQVMDMNLMFKNIPGTLEELSRLPLSTETPAAGTETPKEKALKTLGERVEKEYLDIITEVLRANGVELGSLFSHYDADFEIFAIPDETMVKITGSTCKLEGARAFNLLGLIIVKESDLTAAKSGNKDALCAIRHERRHNDRYKIHGYRKYGEYDEEKTVIGEIYAHYASYRDIYWDGAFGGKEFADLKRWTKTLVGYFAKEIMNMDLREGFDDKAKMDLYLKTARALEAVDALMRVMDPDLVLEELKQVKTLDQILAMKSPVAETTQDPRHATRDFLRDLADSGELSRSIAEMILSTTFNKKLVLAFDTDIAACQAGGPMGICEALERLKEDPKFEKILRNLVIIKAPSEELAAKLGEYTEQRDTEIFVFAPEYARSILKQLESRVRAAYINEKDFPMGSYYPLAEVIAISLAQLFEESIPENALITALRSGTREIDLKDLNIESIARKNNVLIFKLLPDAEPCDTQELIKRYANIKRVLKAA
jgi:hypothetical protein